MTTTPVRPAPVPGEGAAPMPAAPPPEVGVLARLADLVTPMALRVAATLRLVDLISAGATTVEALAAASGTDPDALGRLVRHLVAVGVLEAGGDGRLSPTAVGALLADGHPSNQRSWLDLGQAVAHADLGLAHLLSAVRAGRAVHELAHGRTFWEDLSADPALGASFDALMGGRREALFEAAVAARDWSSSQHVADVGGGTGGQISALLRAEPGLRGTLVELPGPAERARREIAAAGLADRCSVVAGDFFQELPVRADTIVLSRVLHDWPDEDAVRILVRCRDALTPGGRVVLVEKAVETLATDPGFTGMDLRMLVYVGGRERTASGWEALALRAGLRVVSISPPFGFGSSVLELAPDDDAPLPPALDRA
ncbi:methyltransferase [Sphaerisporangium dianthi]|uniref:Methyltransferase n=1 Tax=Sphaerisporangium dianthi TaxID=1436120 RepID=A0ABV9CTU9_9ACTN